MRYRDAAWRGRGNNQVISVGLKQEGEGTVIENIEILEATLLRDEDLSP